MRFKWEVDGATVVEATFSAFGKQVVTVNGETMASRRRLRTKGDLPFALADGRTGTITVTPRLFAKPQVDLRVDGRLFAPSGKKPWRCKACSADAKPYDQFCSGCGATLPSAEQRSHERQVEEATGAMRALAWLFSIFGVILFFVARSQTTSALAKLAGMDDGATVQIGDMTYTVMQLRDEVIWEPWGVLISNAVLAAVMAALAVWGKRWPLPAVVVAMATYAVVIVMNAIADPATIGQGIILKVIIVAIFLRGIKAALTLRTADA